MNRFIAYEKAMKAVDPSIVIIGPTSASPVNVSNGQGKLNREITELPGKLKAATAREMGGISWHWYDGYQDNTIGNIFRYTGPDGAGFNGNNNWSRSYGDTVPKAIESQVINGAPILQVVSEINTLAENRAHISQNHISALFLSDALPRLAKNGVDMANIWVGYGEVGSSFAMVQHSGFGANMRLNSPYYVYYMLSNYFGDQFIRTTPLTNERISIWASRDSQDPGKLKLIITNFSDSNTPATVNVTGFTVGSGVYYELLPDGNLPGWSGSGDVDVYSTLNGKKLDIYNLNASAAAITPNILTVTAGGFTRTFPRYSTTSVILSGTGTQPTAVPASPTSVAATTAPTTAPLPTANPGNRALQFNGTGRNYLDRVEILVDPQVPADVGATDFTIEWWMKADAAANTSGTDSRWIAGAIMFDRDILGNSNRDYGISMFKTAGKGVIRFGVGDTTIQGTANVGDNAWHHVAVTRKLSDGRSCIFVDGVQDTCATTQSGDVSYPNGQLFQSDYNLPGSTRNANPYLVLAAEKHDYCQYDGCNPADYPAYKGVLDEIRISNNLRYTANFTKPVVAFTADSNTVALYHFDEGSGSLLTDTSAGGASRGLIKYLSGNTYPQWVAGFISSGSPTTVPTTVLPSSGASPTGTCPRKPQGDANCDTKVNLQDLEIWTREYLEEVTTTLADFNGGGTCKNKSGGNKKVCLDDLQIWTTTYLGMSTPQATNVPSSANPTAPPVAGNTNVFLKTQGKNILYKGQPIVLKGTNFDNIDTLGANIGSNDVSKISFTEADYAELHKQGGNHVRLGLSFSWYDKDKNLFFLKMDEQVAWAKKHHIWLVFNMFTTPGNCYEGYGNTCGFWASSTEKARLQAFWEDMARRYKDNPTVAGYDILNEPTPSTDCKEWFPVAGTIEKAIHAISPNQLVFIETCSDPGNDLKYNSPPKGANIVYEVHEYSPMGMSHRFQTPYATYPGRVTEWFSESYNPKGCYYDAKSFRGTVKSGDNPECGEYMDIAENYGINWANTNNVPIYIGEWGSTSLLNGYPQYHKDKATLYNELGVHHAHYTWKHQTIKTGGEYQWGIYSRPLNLDDPLKLEAVRTSWTGAIQPD